MSANRRTRGQDCPDPVVFSPARLRAWRHLRNTTHTRLADATHTTTAYVAACERGTHPPDPTVIAGWAQVLGCRPTQLCSATPDGPGEYWKAANEAMGPMSTQDLAVVADVILRSRTHRATHDRPIPQQSWNSRGRLPK